MNGNAALLHYVYQNARMGVTTVEHLLEIVEDERFCRQLEAELAEYHQISESAREHLNKHHYSAKDNPPMRKLRANLMIRMQTLMDKSPSHIAEMMIIGSNMGIIDAIQNIRRYSDAEPDILALMKTLLATEENNVKALKEFL